MRLHELLGIPEGEKRVVSICGAGGKTTLMYSLAREAAEKEKTAVFTTTHILRPEEPGVDVLIPFSETACLRSWEQGRIVCTGSIAEKETKLAVPEEGAYRFLLDRADAVFIEADGSKRLPLKYPAPWEPVIPEETTHIVAVAGLSALGRPAEETVHRFPLAREAVGLAYGALTAEAVAEILWAGYGKYAPVFVLNQADDPETEQKGSEVAAFLLEKGTERVVIGSLHRGTGRALRRH